MTSFSPSTRSRRGLTGQMRQPPDSPVSIPSDLVGDYT